MQEVAGSIYSVTNDFRSYLYLKSANADLSKRLAQLEAEVCAYRSRLATAQNDEVGADRLIMDSLVYRFIPAQVINNSVSLLE
ncbi:MAG: hypothetical protein LBB85_08290, partial [Dysgonamonadaceae bacterium]|nr:hypothetical protein [Dysgonamonadaceae bacterium]